MHQFGRHVLIGHLGCWCSWYGRRNAETFSQFTEYEARQRLVSIFLLLFPSLICNEIYGVLPLLFSHLRALVVIMSNISQDRDAARRCLQ